jgi:hypothetical protein
MIKTLAKTFKEGTYFIKIALLRGFRRRWNAQFADLVLPIILVK